MSIRVGEPMSIKEYLDTVDEVRGANMRWRHGQALFNVLADHRPDLSERLRGTPIDPFHLDYAPAAFTEWLKANWQSNE